MDGDRFDRWTRGVAGGVSRRRVLGGLLGLGAGLAGGTVPRAACPPGQTAVRGACPCPAGRTDTGDGRGCLACHAAAECGTDDACASYACVAGACAKTKRVCDDGDPCTTDACDPASGCVRAPAADGT